MQPSFIGYKRQQKTVDILPVNPLRGGDIGDIGKQ